MDAVFIGHVEKLRPRLERLLAMPPAKPTNLPLLVPASGVYLFSEAGQHLYVGRSNGIRGRIGRHCRPSATHRMAAFAFRLAKGARGRSALHTRRTEIRAPA